MQNFFIRLEQPSDWYEVENLTREAFWNVYRPGCLEHYVLNRFRQDAAFVKELDFVLEADGKLLGHVMYARAEIILAAGGAVPIMTFGPFSIHPDHRGRGLGEALLVHSMQKAKELGAGALAICGDPGYYGRFGFMPGKALGICYAPDPEAEYFLVKELEPGYLAGKPGTYEDPSGYFVDETEAEIFDRRFPPKEKLKLPGQLI